MGGRGRKRQCPEMLRQTGALSKEDVRHEGPKTEEQEGCGPREVGCGEGARGAPGERPCKDRPVSPGGRQDSAGGGLLFRIGQQGGDPDSNRNTAGSFIPYLETDSPGNIIG